MGLFKRKGELVMANQAEGAESKPAGVANKGYYKPEEKKVWVCDHCKRKGHGKDKCWILHPHLKPAKFKTDGRANYSGDVGEASTAYRTHEGKGNQDESIKKSDIEALIKALK